MLKKLNNKLVAILVLALVLRLVGIQHSFPFIFHPDEPTVIRSALGIRFESNPKHFDWPHLYIYINYFTYMAFSKFRDLLVVVGLKRTLSSMFPLLWNDNLVFYFITRVMSACLGAFSIVPIYRVGKRLFGSRAGFLGALTFAILPFHVWHSHYSLIDVPTVFFLSWGLYFSALIIFPEGDEATGLVFGKMPCCLAIAKVLKKALSPALKKLDSISRVSLVQSIFGLFSMLARLMQGVLRKLAPSRNYILAGFFIGLAASTKYNGGLSVAMIPMAYCLWAIRTKTKLWSVRGLRDLVFSGVSSVVGFLLGTPYALLDFDTFIRTDGPKGALWQFTNVGSVPFSDHLPKLVVELWFRVSRDLGYVPLVGFIAVAVWLVVVLVVRLVFLMKRRFSNKALYSAQPRNVFVSGMLTVKPVEYFLWFLVIVGLFLFYYIAGFRVSRSHYYLISYPFVALVFGFLLGEIYALVQRKYSAKAGMLVISLAISVPLFLSVKNSLTFYRGDTRNVLYTWLQQNVSIVDLVTYYDSAIIPVTKQTPARFYRIKPSNKEALRVFPSYHIGVFNNAKDADLASQSISDLVGSAGSEDAVLTVSNKGFLGPYVVVWKLGLR